MRPLADLCLRQTLLAPVEAAERLLSQMASPARLLVAVSGGSDSLGLLLALATAAKRYSDPSIFLLAATIDHGLRPEAAAEAVRVAEFCAGLGIPHVTRRWSAPKPAAGLSAAARDARYELLAAVADEYAVSAILTGHTLDDQFETLAMRQARLGSPTVGARVGEDVTSPGLSGMAPAVLLHRRHALLRPFLATRRHAIRAWLAAEGVGWVEDPSNTDMHYERARTRASLAPIPDEVAAARLSAITAAGAARNRLAEAAADLLDRYLVVQEGVVARLDGDALGADPAVLSHALATLVAVLGGRNHLVGADSMQRLGVWLSSGRPGRLTVGRVMLQRRRDAVFLVRESRDLGPLLVTPGETALWDGRFRITNQSDAVIRVGPGDAEPAAAVVRFAGAPPAVALAGLRAHPAPFQPGEGERQKVTAEPVLRPFDHFALQFDWKLVNSLAKHMGLACFPPSPFNVFARIT
jgi:tRNA(Ile)-lysidine synthase